MNVGKSKRGDFEAKCGKRLVLKTYKELKRLVKSTLML